VTDNNPVKPGIQGYTDNYQAGIARWCTACHSKYMTRGGVWGSDPYNAGDAYGYIGRYRHGVEIPITGRTDAANQFTYNLSTDLPLQDVSANGRTDDDTMTCLTCHMAHGTGARMNGSSVLTSAVRGALPSGSDAMLLRTDGRQMCAECHNMI
jgi:cytochrome c553